MTTRVAINGFGRIGRLTLRRIAEVEDNIEVVAINDLIDKAGLLYAFKYDTAQGRFNGEAELTDEGFKINGKDIKVFAERNPEDLPWGELNVDIVLDSLQKKKKQKLTLKPELKKFLFQHQVKVT